MVEVREYNLVQVGCGQAEVCGQAVCGPGMQKSGNCGPIPQSICQPTNKIASQFGKRLYKASLAVLVIVYKPRWCSVIGVQMVALMVIFREAGAGEHRNIMIRLIIDHHISLV